jgi:hypothetical protein
MGGALQFVPSSVEAACGACPNALPPIAASNPTAEARRIQFVAFIVSLPDNPGRWPRGACSFGRDRGLSVIE